MKNLFSQIKIILNNLTNQDKKLIVMAFIAFLCLVFNSCEVKAVTITDPNPPMIEVKSYTIEELSEIINDLYGLNLDLSTFENSERLLNITNTTIKGIYITEFKMSMNSTEYYPLITVMGTDGTPPGSVWYYTNSTSSVLKSYCMIPYPNYTSGTNTFDYVIDTVNNSIKTPQEMLDSTTIDIWNYNNVFKYLKNSDVLYQGLNDLTQEEMQTEEFQKYAFFEFWDWYSGGWSYGTSYNSSNLLNKQISNKLSYWDYTEDDVYSYWSGDINLYYDYFEVVDFETNVSDYSMYLLRYSVGFDQYGEYYVTGGYEWENISKPNQGGTSKWQIGNLFGKTSGDKIYAIGIGTEETPDLLRSEWFDSDENISGFMISDSFRCRYYIEDLPNFFIPTESSGGYPSGDTNGIVTNPDGDDTDLTGGITGIWQALINLPKTILDGLVGLFVPDAEYFYNEDIENPGLWQRFSIFMQGKLGFLWDVIIFVPNLISTIIDVISSYTETWSITIPALKVPAMTGVEEIVFLESFEWSPYNWINQKVEFRNLYELYLDIIDFFVYWGLIWFFVDTVMTVFGNSDTVIDTTYNE